MTDSTPISRPRPRLPGRSKSNMKDDPPSDASKPDDKAVDDVYKEVNSTGSLELAAKALERYTQKFMEDPEEQGYLDKHNLQEDVIMSSDDEDSNSPSKQSSSGSKSEVVHLQEVVDGLWIGDLVSAMDTEGLQQRGITNILSLLRPALQFSPDFAVYPLEIDDSSDTDILTHLPSCVAWISSILQLREKAENDPDSDDLKAENDPIISTLAATPKLGGVLVHCQAGMSRSATVVAAYLMREYDLDPVQAVVALRDKRPVVDPSETFWHQLGLFYNADGRVSLKDKSTRRFYMERTASQFMNGDGGAPSIDTMAKYPMTPTASNPPTPGGAHGRRKIRCKMCRRHLAVREHMMDHILDQQPLSRPRTPSNVTLPSPKLSNPPNFSTITGDRERRASVVSDVINPLTGLPGRRASHASLSSMTGITTQYENSVNGADQQQPSPGAGISLPKRSSVSSGTPGLSLTASSPDANALSGPTLPSILGRVENNSSPKPMSAVPSPTVESGPAGGRVFQSAEQLASSLPPHLLALRMAGSGSGSGSGNGASPLPSPIGSSPTSSPDATTSSPSQTFPPTLVHTQTQTQQSQNVSNAARRMSMLAMTPTTPEGERRGSMSMNENIGAGGYPILANNKCSGYFVEPLTWMEPVLQKGEIAGKLICPNEKCGVKIGNFDWAGVQCGCRQWVTPGFCIHRSKVDEVW
ncbi:uncharacterized protein I303_105147 [Kwoniella dejecticola CBS 10117]|uniref:protein-tyrosine-phosphatase n=1 Tax=Kwoniella dejecticola CBS 10117 TaxID=1296121 RepID=A0A1A6A3B0_9TREE|nr:uncharacterized protein I303_05407 [Kwoniella dejecticola CBS 10117]OBR84548.1 hypothetical protein I303_05407 [Kwoniella dejecticola CBS 10117]